MNEYTCPNELWKRAEFWFYNLREQRLNGSTLKT